MTGLPIAQTAVAGLLEAPMRSPVDESKKWGLAVFTT